MVHFCVSYISGEMPMQHIVLHQNLDNHMRFIFQLDKVVMVDSLFILKL